MTIDRPFFFSSIRTSLFQSLDQSQVDGMNHLLDVWDATYGKYPIVYLSYCLATAFHETAQTMRPIEEYGHGQSRTYGKPDPSTHQAYYGRGYVQLTWASNYRKATANLSAIGIESDLYNDATEALDPVIAAHVLYLGCIEGWFTGKKLGDYLPPDAVGARRIINGTDKAVTIASYHHAFVEALRALSQPSTVDESATAPMIASTANPVVVAATPKPGFFSWLHSKLSRKA